MKNAPVYTGKCGTRISLNHRQQRRSVHWSMPPRSPTGPSSSFVDRDQRRTSVSSVLREQATTAHHAVNMDRDRGADVERTGSRADSATLEEREQLLDRKASKGALRNTVQQGKVVRTLIILD